MNENYEKMKKSIISNIDAITNLLNIAKALQQSLAEVTDPILKEKLNKQVEEIFSSVNTLTVQTHELFDAYKGLFNN